MKFSKFISYFFHPINFAIIGAVIYFLFVPKYIFKEQEYIILLIIFIGTYIFPLLLLYLMKQFKLINSYHLNTIEERKFPTLLFISISIFIGQWLYKTSVVNLLALYYIGFGLCLITTYIFLNFNKKISLHTAAIGGFIGFLLFFSYHYKINLILLLIGFLIFSGIIATARLELKAHSMAEVVLGYILGIATQLLVYGTYLKYIELQA
ncbi:hypothetical protein SAMN06265371_10576 [Lutibacter agarilyticus]|uniref:PAP2 superfamily protein n=1 Tax=Lutibacter agarilyticus TaxID=1109740 RepID=A0A238X845_9FLAO|nr:hypothetical protein [Lutibacter agarilyticus]SNR55107.1 hypothetical protein SAMN06265371_10576 [Lutibacter agarilyticus]